MHIEDYAAEMAPQAAGNWKKFPDFHWYDSPEDEENWFLYTTSTRDTQSMLTISNEHCIKKSLSQFKDDVIEMRCSHWGFGYVNSLAIRVYSNGEITKAFIEFCSLMAALESYPVLDDSDYSKREYEAQLESIRDNCTGYSDLPEDWEEKVFGWLWDNDQQALECDCDGSFWVPAEKISKALNELGIGVGHEE